MIFISGSEQLLRQTGSRRKSSCKRMHFFIRKAGIRVTRPRAIPHKARLTALHAICVQIFRHIAQKSLAIRQYACGISRQSAEKSDNAPYAQALCGVALKEKTPTKNRLLLSAKTGHFHYPNATSSVIIRANPTAKKIVPTLE